jgi:predicted RNA-binding Zn-ribbon protein involved in translation (DUF1610 family)
MSAYNTVVLPTEEQCPRCGSIIKRRVQFKYGDTWQHDYAIGDRIRWGGNDVGKPATLVKVLAYPEDCPVCGHDFGGVFDVIVRDGVIEEVVPGSTQPYIEVGNASYIVMEN